MSAWSSRRIPSSHRKPLSGMGRATHAMREAAGRVSSTSTIAAGADAQDADVERYIAGDYVNEQVVARINAWLRSEGFASEEELPQFQASVNLVSRGSHRGRR
jgi:hypothetical protein